MPESSIPDDVWEKFVRDSERDIRASAPKEPSARARMVTERLRAMDEAQAARAGGGGKRRWGRKNAPVPPARPEGWRTGPPVQDIGGTSRRRRVWSAVGVMVAVALAVVAVNPSAALSWLPGGFGEESGASDGAQSASGTPLAPETARPGTAPPAAPTDVPTRDKPFAGSPAARWESGADAIRLPAAKPVNEVPAARMAAALKGTKDFLVAANLDPAVLEGARPEKALALVDPAQRDYLAELNAGLRKPTADNDPVGTITRFDPDEIEVVSEARVRGHMTVEAGDGSPGTAVIKADYTFVYPVARTGGGDEVTRTVVRRSIEVEAVDPGRFRAAEGHIRIVSTRSEISNDDCRDGDGVIRPQFLADRQNGAGTSGEARDPYDRSRELTGARDDGECGVVTRL